jgi:hypothetical protein
VLYLGDLDLAGDQIETNTRRVLERGGTLRWERLALTQRQVDEHNLPTIVKRDRRYNDGHPHEAGEPEAAPAPVPVTSISVALPSGMKSFPVELPQ